MGDQGNDAGDQAQEDQRERDRQVNFTPGRINHYPLELPDLNADWLFDWFDDEPDDVDDTAEWALTFEDHGWFFTQMELQ